MATTNKPADTGLREILTGPHYPFRVQPDHAELAIKILEEYDEGPAFDMDWSERDRQRAIEAFETVATYDLDYWQTVFLRPEQLDVFDLALVDYALENRPDSETYDYLEAETRHWYDREPQTDDIFLDEYRDSLEAIADAYEGWRVVTEPDSDSDTTTLERRLEVNGRVMGRGLITVEEGLDGPRKYELGAFAYEGDQTDPDSEVTYLIDSTFALHPHRHAVIRELIEFLEHAEEIGPPWLAKPTDTESDAEPERTEPHRIEFGNRDAANSAREEFESYLCSDDDKRMMTVILRSDTPEGVLTRIEAKAADSRGDNIRSETIELTEQERKRIKELDGFDQTTTVANWRSAKGVFEREGMAGSFWDAIGALTDYDDPSEGAEEWTETSKQAGETAGIRDHGSEEIQEERKQAEYAQKTLAEQCNHVEGHCRNGDLEACEFLKEECGYDDTDIEDILSPVEVDDREPEPQQTKLVEVGEGSDSIEVTPEQAGALKRSWNGYKGAVSNMEASLSVIRESVNNAERAFAAINAIRESAGQEPLEEPERLNDILIALDRMPESIPEITQISDFVDADTDSTEQQETEQWNVQERQGTLSVGVGAEEAAEEKQVTISGTDIGDTTETTPSAWRQTGDAEWQGEPWEVGIEQYGAENYVVELRKDGSPVMDVMTGLQNRQAATEAAGVFTEQIAPNEVSVHSGDSATQEAVAQTKKAVFDEQGPLSQFQ